MKDKSLREIKTISDLVEAYPSYFWNKEVKVSFIRELKKLDKPRIDEGKLAKIIDGEQELSACSGKFLAHKIAIKIDDILDFLAKEERPPKKPRK